MIADTHPRTASKDSVPFERFHAPDLCGAILAGGESRRMGRDKALLEVDRIPLWKRQMRVLADTGIQRIVIVRRPGQPTVSDAIPHIRDIVEGVGPIAGIHAALSTLSEGHLVVLAVDMPGMSTSWFQRLIEVCEPGKGAVAVHDEGTEPLAAVYPREALELIERQLACGRYSARCLVETLVDAGRMAPVPLSPSDRIFAANWNRPEDARHFVTRW